ncbi:hypothetical protein B566_EDAN015294 [Ephemera danica]|nr:hypothetical protein B566_EDAN015294 [Ephemera danica]
MPATLECQQVLAKILTTFNDDEVSSIAKADPLIVKLALNKLMSLGKTSNPHKDYDNVKQRMRLAARFLIIFRTLVKKKNMRLADVFRPEHQEKLYRAVWEMSGFNTTTFEFLRPSIALKIGQILTMSSGILTVEALKVNQVVKFQQINQGDWKKNIGKHVYNLLDIKRFLKISLLSLVKDVLKTHTYLSNQTTYLKNILLQQKSYRAYHELQRNVLSRIVYLNRERVGLVESLKTKFISESEKHSITSLSFFERMLTKHLKFTQNKDRDGKTITWFMTQDLYDAVMLLIGIREEIGISHTNPYVFARLGESKKHINGAIVLRQDTVTAGVENLLLSTSTFLRKHVAIVCQLLSLSELGIQVLDLDGSQDMVKLAKATKMVLTGDEDQDVDVEELIEISEEDTLQVQQDFISNLLPDREEDVNEENVRTKADRKVTKNKKSKKIKDWSQDQLTIYEEQDDKSNIEIEDWSSSQVIEFVEVPIPVDGQEVDSANVEPMEINQCLEVANPIANPEQVDQSVRGKRKRNRTAKEKDKTPVKRRTSKRLAVVSESSSALPAAPPDDIQVSISLCGQQLTLTLHPDKMKRTYECKHTLGSGQQLTISLEAPRPSETNNTSQSASNAV